MNKLYRVKDSKIDKKGLYAKKDIAPGTRIIQYIGKLITKKQTENNDKFDNDKDIYLFNLNNRYDLDGDFKWNTARLINHSCDPNCEVEGKGLEIWVTSIRFIKKGEELKIEDINDFQPHQVNKKKAVYARHKGMRKKYIPTINTNGLRIRELYDLNSKEFNLQILNKLGV